MYRKKFQFYKQFLDSVSVIRIPLFGSTFVFAVFAFIPQIHEILLTIVQDFVSTSDIILETFRLLIAFISIWIMSAFFYILTNWAISTKGRENGASLYKDFEIIAPAIVLTLPFSGVVLALIQAKASVPITNKIAPALLVEMNHVDYAMYISILVCSITIFIQIIFGMMLSKYLNNNAFLRHDNVFSTKSRIIAYSIVLLIISLLSLSPVALPQFLGAIPIFALFFIVLIYFMALFSVIYDQRGIPILSILIVFSLAWSFFGLNDNHRIRHDTNGYPSRPQFDIAFSNWFSNRADREEYSKTNEPYPIYIVAAEGGGIYAAYRTANFLARLQDLCPNFAQHVFGISAVSGGSLGAAVFGSLAKRMAKNAQSKPCSDRFTVPGPFEISTEEVLSQDFLSPLIWASLFPDFLQRFLPFPVYWWDRARSLEYGFEYAWSKTFEGEYNPFSAPYSQFCAPNYDACVNEAAAVPALFLNTTNVGSGNQYVISTIDLTESDDKLSINDFGRVNLSAEIPLSTAVGLSARFPWVTPAGWIFDGTAEVEQKLQFADGGYFENSGVETALKLIELLEQIKRDEYTKNKKSEFVIKLIILTNLKSSTATLNTDLKATSFFGEISAPVVTMLKTRESRGSEAINRAQGILGHGLDAVTSFKSDRSYLAHLDNISFDLPLGWHISNLTRKYISEFGGNPINCKEEYSTIGTRSADFFSDAKMHNDCIVKWISDDLNPGANK